MENPSFLQETKQHGAVRFPFNIYPCTIPGDFPQVALHWQDSMSWSLSSAAAALCRWAQRPIRRI